MMYNEVFGHQITGSHLDADVAAAGIGEAKRSPLFRALDRWLNVSELQLHSTEALHMMKPHASFKP